MLIRLLFLVFGLFWYGPFAHATTVVERPFPELVQQAEVIMVGTVTEVREEWDAIQQAPLTVVTFSDLTTLKGPQTRSLTLYFLGGHTPEGTYLAIPGMPRFAIGEKNVVFSAGNRRDFCPLVGIWQGRLRVKFDPQRKLETVSDNFRIPIVGLKKGRFIKKRAPSPPEDALSLPALIDLIQQELRKADG
jgi:hypothetical protein